MQLENSPHCMCTYMSSELLFQSEAELGVIIGSSIKIFHCLEKQIEG